MPDTAKRPTLNTYIHNLDKRTTVLETRLDHVSDTLESQNVQLSNLDKKLDTVVEHIARQNGTLPRIEEHVKSFHEWSRRHEDTDRVRRTACAQKFEHAARLEGSLSTRTKMIWILMGFIFSAMVTVAVKEMFF
jgi:DNA repair ATPase RecN